MQGKESEAEEGRDRARKGERGRANSASQSEMGRRPSLNSKEGEQHGGMDHGRAESPTSVAWRGMRRMKENGPTAAVGQTQNSGGKLLPESPRELRN